MQLILGRDVDQRVIRDAAPQQKRQPRCQLQIGDSVGLARTNIFGFPFGANQKLRAGQDAAQSQLNSVLKGSFAAALLIETLYPLHVLRYDGASISSAQ